MANSIPPDGRSASIGAADAEPAKADPMFAPVARQDGLPNRVKRRVLGMITEGLLAPGDQLPPERELATQFGVSRNVVREALHSLVDMNILHRRQGSGIFVRELDVESLIEPLEFVVTLEKATLRKVHEARTSIEPSIAALAAHRCTDDDAADLERLVVESASVVDDPNRFLEIDIDLHSAILRIAGNPFLTRIMDSLRALGRNSRELTNTVPEMRATTQHDHERIVAAITSGNERKAHIAMRDHLAHVSHTLDDLE